MRRWHLLELHEQSWYPASWRHLFQRTIGVLGTRTKLYQGMAGPFAEMLEHLGADAIVDLCCGSADPVLQMCDEVVRQRPRLPRIRVILTDPHPDVRHLQSLKERHAQVEFVPYSLQAQALPNDGSLPKVRTVFAGLHRFEPDAVRRLLTDAAKNADGVAIFEGTARRWRNLAVAGVAPFAAALTTSFMLRPWRPSHLLFGGILPVIPWTVAFDGVVSNLRSYTPEELEEIVGDIDIPDFAWKVGTVPLGRTGLRATYLLGWRRSVVAAHRREAIRRANEG